MKFGVVGSRLFNDYSYLKNILSYYLKLNLIDCVVSGGAKGADLLAKQFAKENNIPYKEFLPKWNIYGKSAGYKRNVQIVKHSDIIVAFRTKISENKGTNHTIKIAEEQGKEIVICDY